MLCPNCRTTDHKAGRCLKCGTTMTRPMLTEGAVVGGGRYRVGAWLGKGGMGEVYRAHDLQLDEQVALKTLRPSTDRAEKTLKRFQLEIKLARRVRHRNVCAIHAYAEEGDLRYLVMDLVEGVDLARILKSQGSFPIDQAVTTAGAIAEGLQAIHEAGIVHRDLKTANIMLCPDGTVRVMDFGIAKHVDSDAHLTTTGTVVGTPEYMSPEQAKGEALDARSDVYALTVVTFELFTGVVPFKADTPLMTLLKHLKDPPPLDHPVASWLPETLKAVLARGLEKDRNARYASAEEYGNALDQALKGAGPLPARAPFRPPEAPPAAMETVGIPTGAPDAEPPRTASSRIFGNTIRALIARLLRR